MLSPYLFGGLDVLACKEGEGIMAGLVWTVMDAAGGYGITWVDGDVAAEIVTVLPDRDVSTVVGRVALPGDGRDTRLALPDMLADWVKAVGTPPFHDMNEDASIKERLRDKRFRTSDGVLIVDGLRVWDYDWEPGTVCFRESNLDREYWNGWFLVIRDNGSTKIMNGERLRTRHWGTYAPVPDPPEDGRAELIHALERGAVLLSDGELPVVFDPRTPIGDGDPMPWRNEYYRRYRSQDITVREPGGTNEEG